MSENKTESRRHYVIEIHVSTELSPSDMMAEITEVLTESVELTGVEIADVNPNPTEIVDNPDGSVFQPGYFLLNRVAVTTE